MNEQMDIFSFIEKPQKDTTWRASKPSEVVREDVKKERKKVIFPLYTHCPNCGAKMEVDG